MTIDAATIDSLITIGKFCDQRGWVPATSGNFSAKMNDMAIAITVSGQHKGTLNGDALMMIDFNGRPIQSDKKCSAETLLHTFLYQWDANIGAVLHTHSPAATLLSRLVQGELILSNYELLKAFPGVDSHAVSISIPVFANDQNMSRLAAKIGAYFDTAQNPIVGFLIASHGLYTWGTSMAQAQKHIEALEFLFECELTMRRIGNYESIKSL